jgi:hypothetical protein
MTPRDTRPAFAAGPPVKPQSVPLLDRRSDHGGLANRGNDLERANGELSEDLSRQSSFELDDTSFEQIPLQTRSSWPSNLRRYVALLSRSTVGWKGRSKSLSGARSRSFPVGLFFLAIILMMLSVSPLELLKRTWFADDISPEVLYNSFHFLFLRWRPFSPIRRLISLITGVIPAKLLKAFSTGQRTSPEISSQYLAIHITTTGAKSHYSVLSKLAALVLKQTSGSWRTNFMSDIPLPLSLQIVLSRTYTSTLCWIF